MGSLKEFLAEQAERLQSQESEAAKKRDEWLKAVDRLIQQIKSWLTEADPEQQYLKIQDDPFPIREQGIGEYVARGLLIGLGPREIRVQPVARNVAGPLSVTGTIHVERAYGRVDLTDGLTKYMIFRVEREPEDRWSIIEQDSYRRQPLNQDSFEAAFQDLLE